MWGIDKRKGLRMKVTAIVSGFFGTTLLHYIINDQAYHLMDGENELFRVSTEGEPRGLSSVIQDMVKKEAVLRGIKLCSY